MTGVVGHKGSRGVELVVGVDTPTRISMWRWPLTVRGSAWERLHTVATTHGYEELETVVPGPGRDSCLRD